MTLPFQVQLKCAMSRSIRTSRFTFDAPLGHLSPYIADAPLLVELPARMDGFRKGFPGQKKA